MVVAAGASPKVAASAGRRLKSARVARWASWLKGAGGYVHLLLTRFSEAKVNNLRSCLTRWYRERRDGLVRLRGIGCNDLRICPVCSSYKQAVLAREASEAMLLAQEGIEIGEGLQLTSYGIKLVLTVPKTESKRIDGLLFTDYGAWAKEVRELFQIAYDFARHWCGEGIGGVVSLDYTGESNPVEAHYHPNLYIFPARKAGTKWEPVAHWADADKLNAMRKSWADRVNNLYGTAVPVADFQLQYLGSEGKMRHWLDYLYRPTLSDLWKGWRGFDGELVKYEYGKSGKRTEIYIPKADVDKVFDRVEAIPAHFKRVRWFGNLSDGVRSKTMASLGLEKEVIKDEGDGEKWERDKEFRFLYWTEGGMRLVDADACGDDSCVWHKPNNSEFIKLLDSLTPGQQAELDEKHELDFPDGRRIFRVTISDIDAFVRAARVEGWKYHAWQGVGDEDGAAVFECYWCGRREYSWPDSLIDYRPLGISIGRRTRWREPGAQRGHCSE